MTEELNQNEKKCNCECKELLAKLAIITTGSFLGCLLALCVFTTFAKPPIPTNTHPCPYSQAKFKKEIPPHHKEFKKPDKYYHKFDKKEFKGDWEHKRKNRPDKPYKTERNFNPDKK